MKAKITYPMRLQKYIAMCGYASRRKAEALIEAGAVTINKQIAKIGDQCHADDVIQVNGQTLLLEQSQKRAIYVLNKRLGEVCTKDDPEGRPTVFDRLPPCPQGRWIMVGRLDINTTGLLIFTNDGAYAQSLMHPKYGIKRVYVAKIRGCIDASIQSRLLKGVMLDDGIGRFDAIKIIKQQGQQCMVEVVTTSGRNRIVRRLFEAVGCQVARLKRTHFGSYALDDT